MDDVSPELLAGSWRAVVRLGIAPWIMSNHSTQRLGPYKAKEVVCVENVVVAEADGGGLCHSDAQIPRGVDVQVFAMVDDFQFVQNWKLWSLVSGIVNDHHFQYIFRGIQLFWELDEGGGSP